MTRNVKAAVEAVRLASGLPVYNAQLTTATCEKCKRRYQWREVPETCPWPFCGGTLKAEEDVHA